MCKISLYCPKICAIIFWGGARGSSSHKPNGKSEKTMETYSIFKDLAIIIIFAKLFGILARKCKAPQVVGEIIAGLLIGPSLLGLSRIQGRPIED